MKSCLLTDYAVASIECCGYDRHHDSRGVLHRMGVSDEEMSAGNIELWEVSSETHPTCTALVTGCCVGRISENARLANIVGSTISLSPTGARRMLPSPYRGGIMLQTGNGELQ